MTNLKTLAVVAALVGAAAPAFAQSQLAANAGLTPAEAAGLSLNEIAVAKFNRGSDSERAPGDRHPGLRRRGRAARRQRRPDAGPGAAACR